MFYLASSPAIVRPYRGRHAKRSRLGRVARPILWGAIFALAIRGGIIH